MCICNLQMCNTTGFFIKKHHLLPQLQYLGLSTQTTNKPYFVNICTKHVFWVDILLALGNPTLDILKHSVVRRHANESSAAV